MKIKTEAQEFAQIRLAMRGAKKQTGIYGAQDLIRLALERHDKIAVSWSGGRCSTVVLYMALQEDPKIRVFHTDHGVHYPETINYVRELTRKWNLNLAIYRPEKTFWQVVEEHGFPKARKPMDPKKGQAAVRKPACCRWLKDKPNAKFRKDEGIEAFLTGMRAAEARIRALSMWQKGQFYFHKKLGAWKYNPIAFWRTRELADYVRVNEIPLNPLYKTRDRTGCWPCTAFMGWREQLMRTNLKFYNYLTRKIGEKGEQWALDHFYTTRIDPPCKTESGENQ